MKRASRWPAAARRVTRRAARGLAAGVLLSAVTVLGTLVAPGSGGAAPRNTCIECHSQLDPDLARPVAEYQASIHGERGIGCVGCHGGDPSDDDMTAMDPAKGFKGKPKRDQVAAMCASCHADAAYMKRYNPRPYIFSIAEWKTSVHCKREEEGDQKVATCTNCHGSHKILPPNDPNSPVYHQNVPHTCAKCHNPTYMKGRKVKTDQFALYVTSVHGIALLDKGDRSAPACNDCHGNHGAAPPGLQSITLVCGTCHGRVAELFGDSPMKAGMDRAGMKGCIECHGNHGIQPPTDAWLAVAEGGVCGRCHPAGSAAEKATFTIITGFHDLQRSIAASDSVLKRAELLGMETARGREAWKEAQDRVVGARATLHSFDEAKIMAVAQEGLDLAKRAQDAGESALRDWHNRRVGMALSLVVILIMIVLLVVKIRATEPG